MVNKGRAVLAKERPQPERKDIATPALLPRGAQRKTGGHVAKVFETVFNLSILQVIES